MYSNSKHLLLDDCLSAVDSHTAKHIFEQALTGSLMPGRTCILVSHNVTLTASEASYMVVMNNGKVAAKGAPTDIIVSGALGDDVLASRPPSRGASKAPSRVNSSVGLNQDASTNGQATANGNIDKAMTKPDGVQEDSKPDKKFADTRTESKATGSIKAATIKMYLLAMGPWYYWIFAASAFVATQLGSVATNVWIRQWANAYHTSSSTSPYAHSLARFSTFATTQVWWAENEPSARCVCALPF